MAPSTNTPQSSPNLVQTTLSNLGRVQAARVQKARVAPRPKPRVVGMRQQRLANLNGPTPALRDDGQEMVGSGVYSALCDVKVLSKHSSVFFDGPIKTVGKDAETADRHRLEATTFPILRKNTVLKTNDGRILGGVIKGGMFFGMSEEEKEAFVAENMKAIKDLVAAYPPILPKKEDSRVTDHEGEKERWEARGKKYGRYHFMYNIATGQSGHKEPQIHTHARPQRQGAVEAVGDHMASTVRSHEQVSAWIKAMDPENYEELHDNYQNLGEEKLKYLYQGEEACQSGYVLLCNLAVSPHKDSKDARHNWTTTNCFGKFRGGLVVLQEAGVKIEQEEGDLVFMHAAVLTHWIEAIDDGERYCQVRFTKKDILDPPAPKESMKLLCPIRGCPKSFTGIIPSEAALRKHLRGPTKEKEIQAAQKSGNNSYHFLDKEEAKAKCKEAMAEYDARAPLADAE